MENVKIRFKNVSKGKKKIARKIKSELMGVIMEAMRLKDESEEEEPEDVLGLSEELSDFEEFDLLDVEETFLDDYEKEDIVVPEKIIKEPTVKSAKNDVVNLKSYINELKEINGYKASAILNYTGEILESDSVDPDIDLSYACALFNDLFLSAQKVCQKGGFDETREVTFVTSKGIINIRSSSAASKAHFHVIAILDPDGSHALMKMEIERMMPALEAELV